MSTTYPSTPWWRQMLGPSHARQGASRSKQVCGGSVGFCRVWNGMEWKGLGRLLSGSCRRSSYDHTAMAEERGKNWGLSTQRGEQQRGGPTHSRALSVSCARSPPRCEWRCCRCPHPNVPLFANNTYPASPLPLLPPRRRLRAQDVGFGRHAAALRL